MKNKTITLLIFALILSAAAISSIDGLYTFKMLFNSFAMISLIALGCFSLYRYKKL